MRIVCNLINADFFIRDFHDFCFFKFYDLIAIGIKNIIFTMENVFGVDPEDCSSKNHKRNCQYDDGILIAYDMPWGQRAALRYLCLLFGGFFHNNHPPEQLTKKYNNVVLCCQVRCEKEPNPDLTIILYL